MTAAAFSSDPDLIEAILNDRLSAWARTVLETATSDDAKRHLATLALETCASIGEQTAVEAERLIDELGASGITATAATSDQRHSIGLRVDPDDAAKAIDALRRIGFASGVEWTGSAARSFLRFAGQTTLTKSDLTKSESHSTVVQLRWRAPKPSQSKPLRVLRRAITPTPADWAMVNLPEPLWWAYSALRPLRLIAERLGVASDEHGDLEPFLVTPSALLEPLFDVAEVTEHDVFADIGCGDGRIVVAAAQRHGCRALGVEQSARSVAAARDRVARAALSDRVTIVHADAQDADLTDVTVALLFVPMVVAARLVPALSDRFAAGARVMLHEQSRLPRGLPEPSGSTAIIAPHAVTVAHRWDRSNA